MKKAIEKIAKFILGMILGAGMILLFSQDAEVNSFCKDIFGWSFGKSVSINFSAIIPIAVYVLVSMIIVLSLTYLIRFFTNSRNVKKAASILNVIIQLFLGVPVTTMLYAVLDSFIHRLDTDVLLRIGIGAVAYALLFEGVCMLFEKAFYEKLQKGHKRCRLVICNVLNDSAYEEGEIVVDRMIFEDCYAVMTNNNNDLSSGQFYKIVEKNWNGKKDVDSWRYYHNGDFINETDEVLCRKLMLAEHAQSIQWQG